MVIDHIGLLLFPEYIIFRIIGRISFVLFAFQLVESITHSKHKERYLLTLLFCDLIMVLTYYCVFKVYEANIFSMLFLGGLSIYFLEHKNKYLKLISLFPITLSVLSSLSFFKFKTQYGIYGITLILSFYFAKILLQKYYFYICKKNNLNYETNINSNDFFKYYKIACCIFLLSLSLICGIFYTQLSTIFINNYFDYAFESYALLAFPFILFYSGKRGFDNKFYRISCYAFYPLHLIILYLISHIV